MSITTRALAPAGGCTVRVICMAAMELATANPMDHHSAPKRLRKRTPMAAVNTWPPIILRGCARGLSGTPKARTALAPKGAIRRVWPVAAVM